MIKIAICEDHKVVLKGLASSLVYYKDLSIVHKTENGAILLQEIKKSNVIT